MQRQKEIEIQPGKSMYSPFLFAHQFYDFFAWIHFYEKIKIPTAESCDVMWCHHYIHNKLAILWLYDYGMKVETPIWLEHKTDHFKITHAKNLWNFGRIKPNKVFIIFSKT